MSIVRSPLPILIPVNDTTPHPNVTSMVHLNFDEHPCARERAPQRRYAAVQSAAVSIADAKSDLPDYTLPSYEKTQLVNLIDKTEWALTHVNFSVYYKKPRPSYNESRDLLIQLNNQVRDLNRLLCRNTWYHNDFTHYNWLAPDIENIRLKKFYNATLPHIMTKTLYEYAANMTILANGRATSRAFKYYNRINDILAQLIVRCVVVQCASTINLSLNPPRIGSSEWFYQQLNYTSKIIKAPIPLDLILRLTLLREGNLFDLPGYTLYRWGIDKSSSDARELIVNQINNCVKLKSVNKINLALCNTRYFQNYTYLEYLAHPNFAAYPNNNSAADLSYAGNVSAYLDYTAYMNNHPCNSRFFCNSDNIDRAYIMLTLACLLSLLGLLDAYKPALNALSNVYHSNLVSKGVKFFSLQKVKEKSSDDDEERHALVPRIRGI
jgi:hypothetical protein